MKIKSTLVVVILLAALGFPSPKVSATVFFDNDQTNYVDYPINDFVWVKGTITIVNWLSGANAIGLEASETSSIIVSGGSTDYDLEAYENGNIIIESGFIGDELGAYDQSQISLKGGQVNSNLFVDSHGILTIYGTDFIVEGITVGYIELTTLLGGGFYHESTRHISGGLSNGQMLDNDFYIGGSGKIALVPEPATLLLLGLGAVMVRRKHS